MKIVTAEQMAAIDRYAIDHMGIPSLELMENAGRAVARIANRCTGRIYGTRRIVLFVGKGNNGGDALVAARYLINEHPDITTKVVLLSSPDELKGDALENFQKLTDIAPHSILHGDTLDKLLEIKLIAQKAHLIIDGIFGTGFHGAPRGHLAEAIFFINSLHKKVMAIDIPSGVNGSSGAVEKMAVNAWLTVTFGLPKSGLLFDQGPAHAGRVTVVDIGFPEEAVASVASDLRYLTWKSLRTLLPDRPVDAHKGSCGHLFVLAGSRGLTGAGILAASAAMRAGCGMVTLGCPKSLDNIFETNLIEVITAPLPETESQTLDVCALDEVLDIIERRKCSAVLIGPGLGRHPQTTELVQALIESSPVPMVIDADALNALADSSPEMFSQANSQIIITPHPGELSRLLGVSIKEIQQDRVRYARKCTDTYGVITILKGNHTVLAARDGAVYVNPTGNSGLATAGTGDVLAGLVGSLLVQGMNPLDAACAGVFIHGKVADTVTHFVGKRSLIASDLIKYLPDILR